MGDPNSQAEMGAESRESARGSTWGLSAAIPLAGIAVLTFLLGIVVALKKSPPYYTVRDAWLAFCSLREQQEIVGSPWPAFLWYRTDCEHRGLVQSDTQASFGDFTVYTSADACQAMLVDSQGGVVHRWSAPFREAFQQARRTPSWVSDQYILMRRAVVFPNGDLLAQYETILNTPSGCGLARLDVNGNVLWTYDEHAHHDAAVGDDGRIYALVHDMRNLRKEGSKLALLTDLPIIEDFVTILSPDGRELQRISLFDALVESPYFRHNLIHIDSDGDVTHNNTVNLVGEEFASHYPEVSPGDLMVCLRNLNLVAVVHPESERIVWATTGPWDHPHDPDPLPNGNILIFDNFLAHGGEHGTGVVEFNPAARVIEWLYTGDGEHRLRCDIRGCQQLLPNGNVLITESERGRLVEVNREGRTVWEYVHPVRGGEKDELIPVICGARRYTRAELPFVDNLPDASRQGELSGTVASIGE